MKRPTEDDIYIATMWLEANEGADGEAEACLRVAKWLEQQLIDAKVRQAARKVGCTVKYFRKHMQSKA